MNQKNLVKTLLTVLLISTLTLFALKHFKNFTSEEAIKLLITLVLFGALFLGKSWARWLLAAFFSLAGFLFFMEMLKSSLGIEARIVAHIFLSSYLASAAFLIFSKSLAAYCQPKPLDNFASVLEEKVQAKPLMLTIGVALVLMLASFFLLKMTNRQLTLEEEQLVAKHTPCAGFYALRYWHAARKKEDKEWQESAETYKVQLDYHLKALYSLQPNIDLVRRKTEKARDDFVELLKASGKDGFWKLNDERDSECFVLVRETARFWERKQREKMSGILGLSKLVPFY